MAMIVEGTISEDAVHLLKLGPSHNDPVQILVVRALLHVGTSPATVHDLLTVQCEILSAGNDSERRKQVSSSMSLTSTSFFDRVCTSESVRPKARCSSSSVEYPSKAPFVKDGGSPYKQTKRSYLTFFHRHLQKSTAVFHALKTRM